MSAEDPKDVERLRRAFASLPDDGTLAEADAQRIFDALHGRLSADERQAVVDELLTNPAAAQAWRLAREMAAETADPVSPDAAVHSNEPVSPTRRWIAVAAAAVVAVGLGWQFAPWRHVEEPVYRSVETRAIASALPAGAALARTQPLLRWTAVEGASYRVRVLTPELDVLEESAELKNAEYSLAADTLRRIAPGSQVLWQVEARIPGEAVIVSPTFTIQVP